MKNIAIIVGHTEDSPGACSPFNIPCEYFYNSNIADCLFDIADVYYYDTYKNGYTAMVKKLAKKVNQKEYDLVIELHYNSATPSASGCEVLHYHTNRKTKELAEFASKLISEEFDIKNRGAKAKTKSDRGGGALYYYSAPTILLEPFFGSNPDDVFKFEGEDIKYSETIKKIIEQWEQLK